MSALFLGIACGGDRAFIFKYVLTSILLQLKKNEISNMYSRLLEYICILIAITKICLFEGLSPTLRASIRVCSGTHISDKITPIVPSVQRFMFFSSK